MSGIVGVVVLGMGRSGTSSVTAMLASAGFFAGRPEDLMPANEANPAGHWENLRIYRANERILGKLGGSWFDPPSTSAQLEARQWAVEMLDAELTDIVEQGCGAPVALKDPRIGVMTPIWSPLIAGTFHPMLVIRDPIEIARSLERRDSMPTACALAAWELHMASVLGYLDGQMATIAPYARLIEDELLAASVVEGLASHIDPARVECLRPSDAARAFERRLRHNHAPAGSHEEHLTSRQLALWRWLSALEPGDQRIAAPARLCVPSAAARASVRSGSESLRLASTLSSTQAQLADLEKRLESERRHATALGESLAISQERAEDLEASLAEQRERSETMASALTSAREQATTASAAHAQAERWLAAIQFSVSWRITGPLRAAKRMLGTTVVNARPAGAPTASRRGESATEVNLALPGARDRLTASLIRYAPRRVTDYEIHVPISPTPSSLTRVRYLAASLRRFGGALASSPLIVTVGGDEPVDLAAEHPWSGRLGIEWRWLDRSLWMQHGIYATALQRFRYEIEAPNALLLDADTLFVRPIDDLLVLLARGCAIAGVVAHVSPFIGCEGGQQLWERIFDAAGLDRPAQVCEHPGWQTLEFDAARRWCPPYFNLGVLFAPRTVLRALGETIFNEMQNVERVHPTLFRCQLALTLAIARAGVQWRQLPLRFNLPNLAEYLTRYQAELADARIVHYLKDEQFTRMEDFSSIERVGQLIARDDLHPINRELQSALRQLHQSVARGA